MSTARRHPLEIDEDLEFQRHEWRAQRVGWGLLSVFLIGAMLGFFGGGGPLSSAEARAHDGRLRVEYERFVRVGASTEITIEAATALREPGEGFEVRLGRDYFDAIDVERVVPQPLSVAIGETDVALRFAAGEAAIVLSIQPRQAGVQETDIRAPGGAAVHIRQIAYF